MIHCHGLLVLRMLTCRGWWERILVAVSPTACLESGANVRPWESRILRASAVASNKLCYSLSLWHLYRSFIPHTGPGWRRRWGHCSNGHLFWIKCNLTVLLSCNAANNIIIFYLILIHAINIKVFSSTKKIILRNNQSSNSVVYLSAKQTWRSWCCSSVSQSVTEWPSDQVTE